MTTNFIGVLLPNSPDYTVNTGFSTELYDADGGQTIIVQAGASLTLLGALGANTVRLSGVSADWQVYRDGSNLIAVNKDGSHVELPANATAQTVAFSDLSLALRINATGSTPTLMLGDQVIDTAPAAVGGAPASGSTQKVPWTLIMGGPHGIYTSDGTAEGTKYLLDANSLTGRRVIANADHTAAVIVGDKLYGTDGTAAGSAVLSDTNLSYLYSPGVYQLGNKIIIADGGDANSKGVVTDGTKSGTTVLADVPIGALDPSNQALWGGVRSGPYGTELFRTVISDSGAETVMVKDILSGAGSGLLSSGSNMIALPNGKLVFFADDGSGASAWGSDGTQSGTLKLNAAYPALYGPAPTLVGFGQLAAFTATVLGKGAELVVTDGTPAGTKVLDINPGTAGSDPALLGAVNGLLYFSAKATGGDSSRAIYSTDGTTMQKIAALSADAVLLGSGGGKLYFKASDATYGQELWVVNMAEGSFKLVKDLIPGSGSALNDTAAYNSFMVGTRLAFTAYTSPTEKGFFLSDGTAAGTWQIGKEAPQRSIVLGDKVFFTDSSGVHVVNSSGEISLLSGPLNPATPGLLSDNDQVYFIGPDGTLLVTNGAAPQALQSGITQVKVVGENGVFFVKSMADASSALWFSDGTPAGTFFIRVLPSDYYFDLANAVGLHTAGMAWPSESRAPVLGSASVNGKSLTLAYTDDSPLDGTHLPPASAFQLDGTAATVTAVAVDAQARKVTLTLSQDVKSTDVVLVSYTDPTSGNDDAALQDMFGNDAVSVTKQLVVNRTPDNVPPVLSTAIVEGATLTLACTEADALDGDHLPAASAFKLEGTTATITGVALDTSGKKLILTLSQAVLNTDNVKLSYTDPTNGNDAAAVQDLAGNDAASVAAIAVENRTALVHGKAPWTLLVLGSKGVFSSDGTAAGSKVVYSQPLETWYGKTLMANKDQSEALLVANVYDNAMMKFDRLALGIDGSGAAPVLLKNGITESYSPMVLGHYFILPGIGGTPASGLVTDGTLAGTHTMQSLQYAFADKAQQKLWSAASSQPYGSELSLTVVSDTGAVTTMVKDIWPGSSSGYIGGTTFLSNGKLLFVGNDGTSGAEVWVSDGTEAGTLRLADLNPGTDSSYPGGITTFGALAGFSAMAYQPGNPNTYVGTELVVTDGTPAGTRVLDINPGYASSRPQPVGAVGDTLYFTADIANGAATTRALFSTDGTTFKQLAEVNSTVEVLGRAGGKLFLSVSDAAHGAELWVGDPANGTVGLVKDILAGTGSGLSGTINPTPVGDKLVFQAFTSATTQNLFITDGTADGTVALGAAVSKSQLAGHVLVYGDGAKVYALDGAAAAPKPVELVSGSASVDRMQGDADQVFFSMANGDLYGTDGTAGGTVVLGHSVKNFKVVGENSLYIVEQVEGGTGYGLSYSDGTAAGTYFVGYIDSDVANNLDNSVVVKTVGVPPPGH